MKKILWIILVSALALSGCVSGQDTKNNNNGQREAMSTKSDLKGYLELKSVDFIEDEIDGINYKLYENKTAVITGGTLLGQGPHVLPETVDEYKVIGIAERAFYKANIEGEVVFPKTLQFIDNYAFTGCTELKAINLPESIELVGVSVFMMTGIKEIIIPFIPDMAQGGVFSDCSNLEKVTMLGGNRIPSGFFSHCINLKEVYLPEGLLEIGSSAFRECSIENIELPSTLKVIENAAFYKNSISDIELPESLELIDSYNFEYSMAKNIPDNIKIGPRNFDNQDLGDHYFDTYSLEKPSMDISYSDENEIIRKEDYPNNQIESVIIPEGIIVIYDETFKGFENLTSVILPSTVETICDSAFQDCVSLTEIVIPEGVQYIGNNTFKGCTNLKKVTFPSTLKAIGYGAFENTALDNITIPNSVYHIGSAAFSNTQLVKVIIPGSVENLYALFNDCKLLEEIVISEGVKSIELGFLLGTNVKDIRLPSTLEVIEEVAFGSSKIKHVVIPDNVIYIGPRAFNKNMTVAISEKSKIFNILNSNPQYFWDEQY